MDAEVRSLFYQVAGLKLEERARLYAQLSSTAQARAEVESLLEYDVDEVLDVVSRAAEDLLSDSTAESARRCGPYRLVKLVGAGGMGSVYLAERSDGELKKQVAIKMLRTDRLHALNQSRFLRERQLLATLQHPSIVQVLDAGKTATGRPYLVMEHVEGQPIDRYAGNYPLRDRLQLFLRVCEGVAHAHQHLIIHRDLKPSNILVDSSGCPKLLDFGIAKLLDEDAESTQTADRLLTPGYASPEQLRGELQATSTDIYSLGAVLFKILTGRPPHETSTLATLDIMLGKVQIPAASTLNPAIVTDLDCILKKALRHEPQERYASVDAFANDIRAYLDSLPIEARSGDAWYRARRYLRRHRVPVAAVTLVLASLGGGLYVANRQRIAAEQRFAQLRQLSRKVLQLDGPLSLLPNATKVREQVVSTSMEYLEGLSKESITDDTLALEIADSYLRIGRIQGVGWSYNLGRYDEARKSLERGRALAEAVLARDPKNRSALWLASSLCHDIGSIGVTVGDSDLIANYNRKAAHWLDKLVARPKLERKDVNMATYSYSNLAEREVGLNHFPAALHYAQRAVDISRDVTTIPGPKAQALTILAEVQRLTGDLNGAASMLDKAQAVYDMGPWDNEIYHKQIGNVIHYGQSRLNYSLDGMDLNNPAAGARLARNGLDTAEGLIREDASNDFMRESSAAFSNQLGIALTGMDPAGAVRAFDASIARARELGANVTGRRAAAVALANSSYPLRKLGKPADAGRRLEESLRLFGLIKIYPAKSLLPWSEAEIAARALADHYAGADQISKAVELYGDLLKQVMATNPDERHNLASAACLVRYYTGMIPSLRKSGDMKGAAELVRKRGELGAVWGQRVARVVAE
jgi:serine/threonine protein kinase